MLRVTTHHLDSLLSNTHRFSSKPIYFSKYSRQVTIQNKRSKCHNKYLHIQVTRDKKPSIHILGTNGPNKLLNQVTNKDNI